MSPANGAWWIRVVSGPNLIGCVVAARVPVAGDRLYCAIEPGRTTHGLFSVDSVVLYGSSGYPPSVPTGGEMRAGGVFAAEVHVTKIDSEAAR